MSSQRTNNCWQDPDWMVALHCPELSEGQAGAVRRSRDHARPRPCRCLCKYSTAAHGDEVAATAAATAAASPPPSRECLAPVLPPCPSGSSRPGHRLGTWHLQCAEVQLSACRRRLSMLDFEGVPVARSFASRAAGPATHCGIYNNGRAESTFVMVV